MGPAKCGTEVLDSACSEKKGLARIRRSSLPRGDPDVKWARPHLLCALSLSPFPAHVSIVVTDTIPVVSNRPSGVAPGRPDAARLLVTTAATIDQLFLAWFTDASSTPQRVHGRVVTSRSGTYVDYRFMLWCLFRGLREQHPTRVLYQGDRQQAHGV